MTDEISTFPFGQTGAVGSGALLSGNAFKFTTEDDTNLTENCFAWEERYADLETSVDDPTFTQPFGNIDSAQLDAALGDLVETDHNRPPLGSFVFGPAFDGTCFIIKDNLLYYCKPKQPEYWPALYFIEVSTPQHPGVTGVFHNGQPYYFTGIEIYYIQGTGHGTFFPLPMRAKTGAQSIRGALSVSGKGIYHTGPDGIYLFANGSDVKITEEALEPVFRGETVNGIAGVQDMSTGWLRVYRNELHFGYDEGNVIVLNLQTNRIEYHSYGSEFTAVTIDDTNARLLVGDANGYVHTIENKAYTTDNGVAISWELQSKDYVLQTRAHFPRWVKYDVDASNATVTGVFLLGGEVHHSHTITGNRDTRRRLVEVGNGNRAAIRFTGSGPVSIYAAEAE